MKPFLAVVGGFVVALGTFAGGALVAFMVLKTEPDRALSAGDDVAAVWSGTPRVVDTAAQDFERVAAIAPVGAASAADMPDAAGTGEPVLPGGDGVDTMTTASLEPMDETEKEEQREFDDVQAGLVVAHVDWCLDRYRSYDVDSNTYQPYSGGRRDCVSPHLEELEALEAGGRAPLSDGDARVEFATLEERPARIAAGAGGEIVLHTGDGGMDVSSGALSQAHVRDCFNRYRSYDPATNTYQPYGGGPRAICR